jgi:hypothetical protein
MGLRVSLAQTSSYMEAAIRLEYQGPRVADTHHGSLLAMHHLCKTSSSDMLDEITSSIGMTGGWMARSS